MFSSALIVEPDRDASTAYLLTLADRALRIDYAENGRDALFKILEHPPDLLVTEAHLADLNGFDLCALTRHSGAAACVSIIVTHVDHDTEARARHAGADALLAKPIDVEVLAEAIDGLYARARNARAQSVGIRREARALSEQSKALLAEWRAGWRKRER